MRPFPISVTILLTVVLGVPQSPHRATRLDGVVLLDGVLVDEAVVYLVPDNRSDEVIPAATFVIDQRGLRFVPRVLAVPVGSVVEFANSDPVLHNVFIPTGDSLGLDLGTYPSSESRAHTFDVPGSYAILCQLHPEMAAWVVAVPTSHYATTDASGEFHLADAPIADYTLMVWHERGRPFQQRVRLAADGASRVTIRLTSG